MREKERAHVTLSRFALGCGAFALFSFSFALLLCPWYANVVVPLEGLFRLIQQQGASEVTCQRVLLRNIHTTRVVAAYFIELKKKNKHNLRHCVSAEFEHNVYT